jgi:mRNA interferase MazF
MKVRQFEIWLADLNPKLGTEPGKIRPVVVIQTDLLNRVHPSTMVCPLTTKIQPESSILRVHRECGAGGLEDASDIMIDQVRAIDNRRLIRKKGKADKKAVEKIKENLRIIFDLE